jgi:sigma54-dependent transcription regulator
VEPFQKARLTVNSSDMKRRFTGATGTREGYFEVADGGNIFLDEGRITPTKCAYYVFLKMANL